MGPSSLTKKILLRNTQNDTYCETFVTPSLLDEFAFTSHS
jgi:hypothetical protein